MHGDCSRTFFVGGRDAVAQRTVELVEATAEAALQAGIAASARAARCATSAGPSRGWPGPRASASCASWSATASASSSTASPHVHHYDEPRNRSGAPPRHELHHRADAHRGLPRGRTCGTTGGPSPPSTACRRPSSSTPSSSPTTASACSPSPTTIPPTRWADPPAPVIVDCAVYDDGKRRPGDVSLDEALDAASDRGRSPGSGCIQPTPSEFFAVRASSASTSWRSRTR